MLAAHTLSQLPPDEGREVAFAGRSNAGKSSALNTLCDQNSLARTSRTPGRTQQMVGFDLGEGLRLIDLPGYGYAKVPADLRAHWQKTLEGYFRSRKSLCGLVMIMDARHPLKELDLQMLEWCRSQDLACHILLTKSDKLSRSEAARTLTAVRKELQAQAFDASIQLYSSSKRLGMEEARQTVWNWLSAPAAEMDTDAGEVTAPRS